MRLGLCVVLALLLPCCGGSDASVAGETSGSGGEADSGSDAAGNGGRAGSGGSAGSSAGSSGGGSGGSSGSASEGGAGKGGSSGTAGSGGSAGVGAYSVCRDAPSGGGFNCHPGCSPPPEGYYGPYTSSPDAFYAGRCLHPEYCDQSDRAFLVEPEGSGTAQMGTVLLGPADCRFGAYKVPVVAESCVRVTVSKAPGAPRWGISTQATGGDPETMPRCLVHCYTKPDLTYPNQQWLYVRGDFRGAGGGWVRAERIPYSIDPSLKCP